MASMSLAGGSRGGMASIGHVKKAGNIARSFATASRATTALQGTPRVYAAAANARPGPSRSASLLYSPLSIRQLATPAAQTPYAHINAEDISAFARLLSTPSTSLLTTIEPSDGSLGVKTLTPDELDGYNQDWMNKYKGHSQCVIKPKSTQELAEVLKYCYEKRIAVVPQGGNTGLVGGSVPVEDEVIISTASLNKIRSFDAVSGTLVCDAGCILEVLDNHIAQDGYMMPLDLGAKGSCHIGGNVATNAGGLRFLRYGSLHGNVLGLEVVLPNGEILDGLSTLRKDNTGFDLKQLFIGSEGSIGIITGVSIVTPRRPQAQNVAVFALDSFEAVQNVFGIVKSHCGEILSAFEFFDQDAFDLVQGHATAGVKDPFEARHPFYVLIETSGSNKDHDDEKVSALLEDLMESSAITDGVMAQDETQVGSLWALRESIPEAAGKYGSVYKYDLSMPIPKMNELVLDMRKRFEKKGVLGEGKPIKTVVGYGHIGDGNLHINIVAESYKEEIESLIEPYIYEWTAKQNGSISAEHGLGVMKAEKIGYSKSKTSVEYMQRIKDLFDPKRILNPNKYLPAGQHEKYPKKTASADTS